jgi:hypothetical protein
VTRFYFGSPLRCCVAWVELLLSVDVRHLKLKPTISSSTKSDPLRQQRNFTTTHQPPCSPLYPPKQGYQPPNYSNHTPQKAPPVFPTSPLHHLGRLLRLRLRHFIVLIDSPKLLRRSPTNLLENGRQRHGRPGSHKRRRPR